jgi:hypothetical protein
LMKLSSRRCRREAVGGIAIGISMSTEAPSITMLPGPTAFASSWCPETQASREPYRNRSHADFTCWNVGRNQQSIARNRGQRLGSNQHRACRMQNWMPWDSVRNCTDTDRQGIARVQARATEQGRRVAGNTHGDD